MIVCTFHNNEPPELVAKGGRDNSMFRRMSNSLMKMRFQIRIKGVNKEVSQGTSQNDKMGQVGRNHTGPSGPASLLKLGHPRPHGTGPHPDSS